VLLALVAACASRGRRHDGVAGDGDPARGEVVLPGAAEGWRATLVLDEAPTGIWTVRALPVLAHTATPELVGLDDRGRCHVCISYSGKWTPRTLVEDGGWLGALAHGDVDPRLAGAELYAGGERGNLYQVVAHPHGALDCRLIAHLPGRELHTLLAGELDPGSPGPELLAFTRPGGLFRITPTGPDGTFETTALGDLPGRVRDALVLPPSPRDGTATPRMATVSRSGELALLELDADGPRWTAIESGPMGRGRLARAPSRAGEPLVLYSTLDDGRVQRHAERADGGWRTETIYAGPQGPRGLAAGRFHADPELESVAVFGYSRDVRLLTRTADGWQVEPVFRDLDRGHWLERAELDGRNGTDELVTSGYAGRIVLLARPPGYGSDAAVVDG